MPTSAVPVDSGHRNKLGDLVRTVRGEKPNNRKCVKLIYPADTLAEITDFPVLVSNFRGSFIGYTASCAATAFLSRFLFPSPSVNDKSFHR